MQKAWWLVVASALKVPAPLVSRRSVILRETKEDAVVEPEDENPDQPDIIKKFVNPRDDWWSSEEFAAGDAVGAIAKSVELPSYFWLLGSTFMSIAFIGSIFQIFYNNPPAPVLGVPLTSAVLVTSGPAFIFMFLIAIVRGQKEAQDDDARYM